MMRSPRSHDDSTHGYVNPERELNTGLWTLFAGATAFLALRIWIKVTRRHGLWYDDYILLISWLILTANNSLISVEYATGYVADKWDDRMHILINITSCGTLIGQSLTKTAFAVTLLKLTKGWQQWFLWFCIGTMNLYMVIKVVFQWAKICNKKSYDVWYRLDVCLDEKFRDDFKEGGNVYNIIMDFCFALFPWLITWKLDMRKSEKIGLCVTMSLGMVVAIVAAVRVTWKDEGNGKDELYFWRNAMSNIWYSSEVAGTIIVQCVPVLRTLLRDIKTSMSSKKLPSTNNQGLSRFGRDIKGWSASDAFATQNSNYTVDCWADENGLVTASKDNTKTVELTTISEDYDKSPGYKKNWEKDFDKSFDFGLGSLGRSKSTRSVRTVNKKDLGFI